MNPKYSVHYMPYLQYTKQLIYLKFPVRISTIFNICSKLNYIVQNFTEWLR
jgi:hypothetical protein